MSPFFVLILAGMELIFSQHTELEEEEEEDTGDVQSPPWGWLNT